MANNVPPSMERSSSRSMSEPQREHGIFARMDAEAAIYDYRQSARQSTSDYYNGFTKRLSVFQSYGGRVMAPPEEGEEEGLTAAERDERNHQYYWALVFIQNADPHRYEALRVKLSNDFVITRRNQYPKTLTDAYQLLLSYKTTTLVQKPRRRRRRKRGNRPSVAPQGAPTGKEHFPNGIPKHFILLGSGTAVSIFCNPQLLTDIHEVEEPLRLVTGGGQLTVTQMGTIPNFGDVWYHPDVMANSLSLAQVSSVRRVTMDTETGPPAFHVHRASGGGYTIFKEHPSGLYLHDPSDSTSVVTGDAQ